MKQSLEFSKEQRFHNASIHTSRSTTAQGEMLQEVAIWSSGHRRGAGGGGEGPRARGRLARPAPDPLGPAARPLPSFLLVKIPTHDTEDARPTASLGGAAWQTR